jgi:endo-1,4-beta-xylanase
MAGLGGAAGAGGSAGLGGAAGHAGAAGAAGAAPLDCPPATTLKQAADCTDRLIGAALAASRLSESGYATAAREHNYVTAENEMKWGNIEPSRGSFSFGSADQIVNFATTNGMKVKGHTLVWFDQNPSWLNSITSATDLRDALVDHINGVMDHYKGKITDWDVVNEAWISTGRTGDGEVTLRDSVWSRVLGESYIDEAFVAARAADPEATLIYNDFANEGLSDKSDHVYEMVKSMKMRGIPIDGVGMQMHVGVNTAPSVADVTANMQRLAELGLKIYVSEMDVNGCAGYSPEEQRKWYHDMVAVCVAQPACVGFTVWGITDKYSWLNSSTDDSMCSGGESPLPLLWDDNYMKKSAYTGVLDALLGK